MKKLKIIKTIIFLSILFTNGEVLSHDHGHKNVHSHGKMISFKQVKKLSLKKVSQLVDDETLASSWKKALFINASKEAFGNKKEWVVNYINKNGIKGKNLYLFYKLDGTFLAANFTGK